MINRKLLLSTLILFIFTLLNSNDHVRDLEEILDSGYVRVGIRPSPTVFIADDNGQADNYVWSLVEIWAKENGVEARPVIVDTMRDYWLHNGVIPENLVEDDSVIYTPDIYRDIDFAADVFSRLPWREKLVDMHTYLQTQNILIARKSDNIETPDDLLNKRVYVVKNQSGYKLLTTYLNRYNLGFSEYGIYYSRDESGITHTNLIDENYQFDTDKVHLIYPDTSIGNARLKPLAFYQWLLSGEMDVLINNSLSFFIYNIKNNSMRRYLEPIIPIADYPTDLCFTSPKESSQLSNSLKEFLDRSQKNGVNDRLLLKHAGISLEQYNLLIKK